MRNRAEILKQQFQNSLALPFEQVLSAEVLQRVLEEQGMSYRNCLYTPIIVVWAWVSQVLDEDKSLSNAVSRVTTWLAVAGERVPSADTGGYSKARNRLPLRVLESLLRQSAIALASKVKPEQRWCGRQVKAYDGTTVQMSDTAANQEKYPQHSNQKTGCGFPLAKLVVWFCAITGAVLEVSIASFNTSEWQLSRRLYAKLQNEDVPQSLSLRLWHLRRFGSGSCSWSRCGMSVNIMPGAAISASGKKLGIGDHRVGWQRPQQCPQSMRPEEFEALPTTLEVREVHLLIQQPGFRPAEVILVTTLVDPKRYPKTKLAELYQLRWLATEVNFKHLKTTLQMEMIPAKTPEMVQKDIWVHLLTYNLLRDLMWQAAQQQVSPLRISLQGTRQQFNHFRPHLAQASTQQRRWLYTSLLEAMVDRLVPFRPNRKEPRVTKRRPKPFPRMQQPRSVLKAKLAA